MIGKFSPQQIKTLLKPLFNNPTIEPIAKGISSYTYRISELDKTVYLTIPQESNESLKARYSDTIENKVNSLVEFQIIESSQAKKIIDYIVKNKNLFEYDQGVLMHDDFVLDHIFADKNSFTGIIDWEAVSSGSPFNDLAQFSTYNDEVLTEYLLKGYFMVSETKDLDKFFYKLKLERIVYCISKTAKAYVKNQRLTQNNYLITQKKLIDDLNSL